MGGPTAPFVVVILAGVAGVGKTTVGTLLASQLHWDFLDGDDLHSLENIQKMNLSTPLTDQDRRAWLCEIREEVIRALDNRRSVVIACSALKKQYVDVLTRRHPHVACVLLEADYPVVLERLHQRTSHFFPPALLKTQFEDLESDTFQFVVDASPRPAEVVRCLRTLMGLSEPSI